MLYLFLLEYLILLLTSWNSFAPSRFRTVFSYEIGSKLSWHGRKCLDYNGWTFSLFSRYCHLKCTTFTLSEDVYGVETVKFTVKHKSSDFNDAIVGECSVFLPALLGRGSYSTLTSSPSWYGVIQYTDFQPFLVGGNTVHWLPALLGRGYTVHWLPALLGRG